MASLPSVLVSNTLKLEPHLENLTSFSLPTQKINYNTVRLDKGFDPFSLDFREAISVIREGSKFESSFYLPLLQECINKNSVSEAQIIHSHIIKTGTNEDLFLMTFLVNVYAKCGNMETASKLFYNLPRRNVVTWTSLISGYVRNSQPEFAVQVFREMLEFGAYPTNRTLGIVLNACSSLCDTKFGKQIHGYIVKYKVEFDTSIGNALCSIYSKCGILNSAIKAFFRIEEKNVISWTTVITACGDNGDSSMGLSLFIEMLCDGNFPNEFTLTNVLSLCCVMKALGVGLQVHALSIKLGYGLNLQVINSIMYLYLKCGWINEAKKLFDGMETVSLVTWNAMIAGHAQTMDFAEDGISAHDRGTKALNIFLRLNQSGTKPDLFTFSSVLTVCSNLVALDQGEQVHAMTIKTGFLSDVVVGTALVNMYNKCGSIERTSKAFVEMSIRTLISWTSMIMAFAQNGFSRLALQLFEDMRFAGVRPNKITFLGVFSACSHAGIVDKALDYFEMMKNEYRIKPVMDHYSCFVDMFARLGRLDEALSFIKEMDFEPNEFIWLTFIAGCRIHGNKELGFYAAEQLLSLNPKDSETYDLLFNMYRSAGRWEDVSRVGKIMKDRNIGKLEDWSWISIRDKVHSFNSDEWFRSPCEGLGTLLEDLVEKARTLGYELEQNEEKTSFPTTHHSEKLAVAFGLLNTQNAASIRVIKSISICRDCHNFMKFVSVLVEREIIVRDSKRLHRFVNGHCSCGDFGNLL